MIRKASDCITLIAYLVLKQLHEHHKQYRKKKNMEKCIEANIHRHISETGHPMDGWF